jgi:hypothetical protein
LGCVIPFYLDRCVIPFNQEIEDGKVRGRRGIEEEERKIRSGREGEDRLG